MNTVTTNISIVFGLFILVFIIMIVSAKNRKKILIYPFQVGGEQHESQYVKVVIKGTKWNDVTVWFAGKQVAVFRRKALFAGQDLQLSDGSRLNLQLSRNQFQPEQLKISRNRQPIHRIVTEAMQQVLVDYASNAIYFIGISSAGVGVLSLFMRIQILEPMTFGWPYILFGSLFLVLGFFTRKRSMPALILAIVIYLVDGILGVLIILAALTTGSYILIGNSFMHLVLLMAMANGIDGINGMRGKQKSRLVAVFSISVAVLMILILCALSSGIIYLMLQFGALLTPGATIHPIPPLFGQLFNPGAPGQPTIQVVQPSGGSCTLTISDPTGSVYIRDLADATTGKVIDYLDGSDIASVLGTDGGSVGDAWWYIEVNHRGKTSRGWVFANVAQTSNNQACSSVQTIATPFP
jgi:hypothetical protein